MPYTADTHDTKVYLQDRLQQHTEFSTMQLILCYIHKDKYIKTYNEFILQLQIYAKAIRILAKGYLPTLLMTPF